MLPKLKYYHIDRVLSSSGGSSVVYWGIDLRSGFPVAIKKLYSSKAKQFDLKKEANDYLYLSHKNLTKLIDFVIDGDQSYLVMEFVEGQTLDEYQKRTTGPMSEEIAIPIFRQLLDTVAYLHHNNTLHLDIKPNNVMIQSDMSIKLIDLGISSKINGVKDNPKICGTPAFMPPEQFEKKELGRYTDIFALGVTLYSMLTAHLPFKGNSHTEIWNNISIGNYTPPEFYYPHVNPNLTNIVVKAINPNPSERFQTCEEMHYEICNILKIK